MANAREQMKKIDEELERIRAQIARLTVEEETLVRMKSLMAGEAPRKARVRAPSVKPVVLDIMRNAGQAGASSAEVDQRVRETVPSVAKDTVGSVLSRLKSQGALVYVGDRYYEKQFAPRTAESPFDAGVGAVH